MANLLSQQDINEYKECFSLHDARARGRVPAAELLTIMRCLGACPTPAEADAHLRAHSIGRSGELDFSTFLAIMHAQRQRERPEREILAAFRALDPRRRGFVTAAELRGKLTRMGERMRPSEVDEMLREANVPAQGVVRYEAFVASVLLPAPDYK
ncbi:calmodulin-like protein 4 [Petromyzon marinus]|uniref:Calmodulin-like protein 4 n=1 Tax=Petromyzon marinus TaxID=7757 RepID=A0AAJ7SK46_PETMA|nr:calmodulin-like protein 4 [Petromyzon marinus]